MHIRAGLLVLAACGRIGFDGSQPGQDAPQGPSMFGQFNGLGSGRSIATIGPNEDLIVAGWAGADVDLGGGVLANAGGADVFVARYTLDGVHRWSTSFGSAADDAPNEVIVDASGNIYLTGYFFGAIDFGGGNTLTSLGDMDAFVVSFTGDGAYRWSRRIGSTTNGILDSGHSIAVGQNNDLFVVGLTVDTADAGGTLFTCAASDQAMFIAALDTDGSHRWSRCYGVAAWNSARGAAVDAAGNLTITGYYTGALDLGGGSLPSANALDIFVASFQPDGAHRWSKGFGSSGDDWGNKVAVDSAGNVFATGFFQTALDRLVSGGVAPQTNGKSDGYLVKFDSTGAFQWVRTFGGTECDLTRRVSIDDSGDAYVTGVFVGTVDFGSGPVTAAGVGDGYIARFASDGTPKPTLTLGGPLVDETHDVVITSAGLIVTGEADFVSSTCPNTSATQEGSIFLRRL